MKDKGTRGAVVIVCVLIYLWGCSSPNPPDEAFLDSGFLDTGYILVIRPELRAVLPVTTECGAKKMQGWENYS